ncbi:mechanosensitive ion channel family protein, partial [Pseudomonadota bacterium]
TIPFGEMHSLTNYSRDWVIMKLEFRVPFDTDLKLVKNIVKTVGKGLLDDPEIGPSFLDPLKSQGVRRMEEFNMVVGVKFKAKPGEQWTIRKLAYQRIRDAFDRHGLVFAERNVKVEVVGADEMTPEIKDAAAGAAQTVLEQKLPPTPAKDEP